MCMTYIVTSWIMLTRTVVIWFSIKIISCALSLPVSQIKTHQQMMSQIRSHVDYLPQTFHILLLILHTNLVKNLAKMTVFNTTSLWFHMRWLTFWATLYMEQQNRCDQWWSQRHKPQGQGGGQGLQNCPRGSTRTRTCLRGLEHLITVG